MVTDPIGDMLIQIKNAALIGKRIVELPYSRMKEEVAKILVREGYLIASEKQGEAPKFVLRLELKYENKRSVITNIKRVSKPGLRWYINKQMIPKVLGGMGIAILSTSSGVMTGRDAHKKSIGGELLCEIW